MNSLLSILLSIFLYPSFVSLEENEVPIENETEFAITNAWFTSGGSTVTCLTPGNTYRLYAKFYNSDEPCMCVETLVFPGSTPPTFLNGSCRDVSTSGYYTTSVQFVYNGGNVTFTVKEGCGYPYNNSGNYTSLTPSSC